MDINQNIKSFLEDKNLTQKALSQHLGIATSTINNWLKLNRSIPAEYIIPICEFLDTSPHILLTGQEKSSATDKLSDDEQELLMYYSKLHDIDKGRVLGTAKTLSEIQTSTTQELEEEHEEQETIFIEFATLKASAGTGEQLIDDPEQDFIEVVKNDTTLQAKFAIQIHGDSMEPEYSDGDIVLVKTQPQINVGQIGIFTVNDMGYIKKLGTDRLVSINPEYDDIYFEERQDIRCKGLVIGTLEEEDFT